MKMFFTLNDVQDNLEMYLEKWFEKKEILKPVYNLYFEGFYNNNLSVEQKFLNLIQALESYHRRIEKGKYLSNEEYNNIYNVLVKAIPEEVDEELKERLKGYLKYGNEYSLRKRLKQIYKKYKKILDNIVDNKKRFIDKVVKLRNYLTHYDDDSLKEDINIKEIYDLNQKLEEILRICLLLEIGFENERIKELLKH